ncbi:MAG: prepilin-type N-terminal cleavage/methylation domain-containing protein [Candidatus Sumerlaeia bacterium]|nr:prepilin-type N-terminal cleavage/methylation domain-containing protein [Candidatus Sumerlaeia bacterium]
MDCRIVYIGLQTGGASRRRSAALSLYELLVVLALVAILTLLLFVSAQQLMISSRISRVQEEHRVLTRALQNYESDYGMYPGTNIGLRALCAPVAYMVRIPNDPFSARSDQPYVYIGLPGRNARWILISEGPDRKSDVLAALGLRQKGAALLGGFPDDRGDTLSLLAVNIEALIPRLSYDPTNGLVSGGDIITVTR